MSLFISGYLNHMFYHLFRNFSIIFVLQNCVEAKDNAKKNISVLNNVRVCTNDLGWMVPQVIPVINNFCYTASCMHFYIFHINKLLQDAG